MIRQTEDKPGAVIYFQDEEWPTHPLFNGSPGQYNGIPDDVSKEFSKFAQKILIGALHGKFNK